MINIQLKDRPELKSLRSHSEQSWGLILRGQWQHSMVLHNVPNAIIIFVLIVISTANDL